MELAMNAERIDLLAIAECKYRSIESTWNTKLVV